MSWGYTLLNAGSIGQRSRSQCIDYWKWFLVHNCFRITPIVMKLLQTLPMSLTLRGVLLNLDSKDQGHNASIAENGLYCLIAFSLHLSSLHCTTRPPWVEDLSFIFQGQKVKVTTHWLLYMFFFIITAFPLHLPQLNFTHRLPMSQGCALLILGSKGQGHNTLMTENG